MDRELYYTMTMSVPKIM